MAEYDPEEMELGLDRADAIQDQRDDMYDDDPELDEPLICASCSHAVGSEPFRCNCCQEPICSMCRETGFGRCDFCWEERE
jgi:hypothetical protein